jgi:hypothetical protein
MQGWSLVGLLELIRTEKKVTGLPEPIRFLVVELIYSGLNLIFNMSVIFIINYFFSKRRHPIDNETFLMIDFVNLKIKLTQSFRGVHRGRVYVHIFIGMSDHTCINICICPVFLKKKGRIACQPNLKHAQT